ncbi:iron complex transport system ATP-binding protein [Mycobacterium frederiksbergense]|jgi:iron complex transport system ATP-binding protein|uniref:Iron complex transport system ATP-binding protein n=1 Tax=Mycolicibacterium frederiksbergense TaxID=117567 RepID=A0ABT6KZ44_9MYCO|nr:ATP-binding cassette domain-containing protein [Mycolicibacterium frederiksbergense]MDH6195934.1 iron complex transport system ATP-binding protein [Mycolicibacterium frederiksbergense]
MTLGPRTGPIAADGVSWSAGGRLVIDGVSLMLEEGETLGLLGPNGAGKSSLLRLLAGLRRPGGGAVLLDGKPLTDHRRRAVARRIAVVEQQVSTDIDLTVEQIVRLGRIPHRGVWGGDIATADGAVERALEQTGTAGMRDRDWRTLSGGEQQRVQIARALAQQPRELLLDEPTNHLDIRHQFELLGLIRELPVTAVVTLHDLTLAALFCDRVIVLTNGHLAAAGAPAEVLTPTLISAVYGVDAHVIADGAGTGRPSIHLLPPQR